MTSCWICDSIADSSEHMIKKSDLKSLFEEVDQKKPLFFHNSDKKNKPVGSFDSKILKFPKIICTNCNTTRSQPYDRAWEALSGRMQIVFLDGRPNYVRVRKHLKHDTRRQLALAHIFFTKILGCILYAKGVSIDLVLFRRAVLEGKPHPNVFIRLVTFEEECPVLAGISEPLISARGASFFYEVGKVIMQVSYAIDRTSVPAAKQAWNPSDSTTKLPVFHFNTA